MVTGGFGALLRHQRERVGLTQERLAERAGLGVRTVRYLERDQVRPLLETVRLLGDALGLDGAARARFDAAARAQRDQPPAGPPAVTRVVAPDQLPPDLADFTGRERELDRLDRLLPGDGPRTATPIAVVAGPAGVGKTAFTTHWAHLVADRFPDGRLHVNLRGHASGEPLRPIQALGQLLESLGVKGDEVPIEVDAAAARYRSLLAGRRALVLLDDARDAEQVRPLLPGGPDCFVLITSRDRLAGLIASHGARRLSLAALTPAEAAVLLERIAGPERVGAEPDAVAELARLCGLFPLALRVAAANLTGQPDQSIAGYVERLRGGDRLERLTVRGDPGAAVALAFEHSYRRLTPAARRLFRALVLVPGPELTVPAAAAVGRGTTATAERLLEELAAVHLIEPRGPDRYQFHDLLRLYADQRALAEDSEPDRQAASGRLLDHLLRTVDRAAGLLYPQIIRLDAPAAVAGPDLVNLDDRNQALAWLDAERPNLVAAVQAAADRRSPMAWLLADALRGYFWLRRSLTDMLATGAAGLAAASALDDPHGQAAGHQSLALAYLCLDRQEEAAEHVVAALAMARRAGWAAGEAASLGNLGSVLMELGRLEEAGRHHAQALARNGELGLRASQAVNLHNLGTLAVESGRLERARDHFGQALDLNRAAGSPSTLAASLTNLGAVFRDLGQLDRAREHLDEALALAKAVGDAYRQACAHEALATVQRDAGDYDAALESAPCAVALAREVGDLPTEADGLNALGSVYLRLGRHHEALLHHEQALDLARGANARLVQGWALVGLSASWSRLDRPVPALSAAQQALAGARRFGYRALQGLALTALAEVHLGQGRFDQAATLATEALACHRRTGHRLGRARALAALGQALRETRGIDEAIPHWQRALDLFTDVGSPDAGRIRALLRH